VVPWSIISSRDLNQQFCSEATGCSSAFARPSQMFRRSIDGMWDMVVGKLFWTTRYELCVLGGCENVIDNSWGKSQHSSPASEIPNPPPPQHGIFSLGCFGGSQALLTPNHPVLDSLIPHSGPYAGSRSSRHQTSCTEWINSLCLRYV